MWRVTWAHPEFGQVLATCSFDRTAAVWEKEAGQNHWLKRTSLVDSRTSVTDVKFAPKHMGLQLVMLIFLFFYSTIRIIVLTLSVQEYNNNINND